MKRIALGLSGMLVLAATMGMLPAAYAQQTRAATGSGTGGARCSGGGPFPATIGFSVTSAQGTTSGTYTVTYTASIASAPTTGIITGGHVNHHSYKLDGLRVFDPCTPTLNIPISIEGACGTGVTITYEVEGLVSGTFTGDVTCT